jgi:cysteine desulfurase
MRKIYLDYAATSPLDARVRRVMNATSFGNPNSLHAFGQEAQRTLDAARTAVAGLLGAESREVIFTGSATEANNAVLRGIVGAVRENADGTRRDALPKIIISAIEHESVYETARALEKSGAVECVIIPVDEHGTVDIKKIEKVLDDRTILVSVMYVNNETGSVQPIVKISELIKGFRNSKLQKPNNKQTQNYGTKYPLFHCDAVQAFQYFDCDVNALGVDFLTLSAHKIYGPKGVGVLYIRNKEGITDSERQKDIIPIITGGGQEFGMRSGTQNVPGIVGFSEAATSAVAMREKNAEKMCVLKKKTFDLIRDAYPRAELNGGRKDEGSPHIMNVWLPGIPSELLLIQLDQEGIAVSGGSACHARAPRPSRTVAAMHGDARAKESVRISFGRGTTFADVRALGRILREILGRYSS